MPDESAELGRIGRPKGSATGVTPIRTLRVGPLWEQGKAVAKEHGMTMTALVEEALRREIARLERARSK